MKTNSSLLLKLGIAALLAAATSLYAVDDAKDPVAELNKHISESANFYTSLQSKPETAVPAWVVSQAKGVIILTRWSGAAGIGGTSGAGIGMKKGTDGKFSAPAFYTVGGTSLGLQLGGGKTQTIAFLMSDAALKTLTDSKFVWSGNVRAVAGDHSSQDSTVDNKADVVLYQQSSGLDAGATVAATQVSIDNEGNRKFYGNPTLTPVEIFTGKIKVPDSAKPLVDSLNKQAK